MDVQRGTHANGFTITVDWPHERPALGIVLDVIDGDTVRMDIDLGLRSWLRKYKLRLNRSNAWEKDTEAGLAARDNLARLLPPGTVVILTMLKDYKYGGEFVGEIWLPDAGTTFNLIDELIAEEWLAPWDGRGAGPVPPWPRAVQ